MKKYIALCLIVISVVLITGCANKEEQLKLRIKESSWSGWIKDYKPKETTNDYEIELDKEYSINSDNLKFTIKEIGKDYIIIKTDKVFSDKESGIDLLSKKTEFKVYLDKETKLTEAQTDEGNIYYLSLVK